MNSRSTDMKAAAFKDCVETACAAATLELQAAAAIFQGKGFEAFALRLRAMNELTAFQIRQAARKTSLAAAGFRFCGEGFPVRANVAQGAA